MQKVFKGDIVDLVPKSTFIAERLHSFKTMYPWFNYKIELRIKNRLNREPILIVTT